MRCVQVARDRGLGQVETACWSETSVVRHVAAGLVSLVSRRLACIRLCLEEVATTRLASVSGCAQIESHVSSAGSENRGHVY